MSLLTEFIVVQRVPKLQQLTHPPLVAQLIDHDTKTLQPRPQRHRRMARAIDPEIKRPVRAQARREHL